MISSNWILAEICDTNRQTVESGKAKAPAATLGELCIWRPTQPANHLWPFGSGPGKPAAAAQSCWTRSPIASQPPRTQIKKRSGFQGARWIKPKTGNSRKTGDLFESAFSIVVKQKNKNKTEETTTLGIWGGEHTSRSPAPPPNSAGPKPTTPNPWGMVPGLVRLRYAPLACQCLPPNHPTISLGCSFASGWARFVSTPDKNNMGVFPSQKWSESPLNPGTPPYWCTRDQQILDQHLCGIVVEWL